MIFKIQLPLATNEAIPLALVYNEDRSIKFTTPVEKVEEWFIHHPFKIFVEADYFVNFGGKEFIIKEIVEDKDW